MKSSKLLRKSAVGWVSVLLLLAQQLGCANAVPILSAAKREEAFIGYSEQKAMRSATNCIDKETGCNRWAENRECLLNPTFMRGQCPKSCRVKFVCGGDFADGPPIEGHANVDETKIFSNRHPGSKEFDVAQSHFRFDPSMSSFSTEGDRMRAQPWQTLSSLGVGLYLGNEDAETDELVVSALIRSVARGWNVIDTARNYRSGRGEAAAGEAIATLLDSGVRRGQLFVSTKAGYLPAATVESLISSKAIDKSDYRGGSCIHPACLEASLSQSLAALHLKTVDLLYLHNAAEGHQISLGKVAFMSTLKLAFAVLEKFRQQGRIRAYGLATWNCFRVAQTDTAHLSLQEVVDLAFEVGGRDHGFRYIQLPINAGMREAWEQPWQNIRSRGLPAGGAGTVQLPAVEAAVQLGVGVFASGSLGEGDLLKDKLLLSHLRSVPELQNVQNDGVKLLQLARSTPYVICALVGHKSSEHVADNLHLSQVDLLTKQEFHSVYKQLDAFGKEARINDLAA